MDDTFFMNQSGERIPISYKQFLGMPLEEYRDHPDRAPSGAQKARKVHDISITFKERCGCLLTKSINGEISTRTSKCPNRQNISWVAPITYEREGKKCIWDFKYSKYKSDEKHFKKTRANTADILQAVKLYLTDIDELPEWWPQ